MFSELDCLFQISHYVFTKKKKTEKRLHGLCENMLYLLLIQNNKLAGKKG